MKREQIHFQEDWRRLDQALAHYLVEVATRSQISNWIKQGHLTNLEGKVLKAKQSVKAGETVVLIIPDPLPQDLQPQAMDLDIIYEDQALLVINKPTGLVVHPGAGNPNGTLVNGLLAYNADQLSEGSDPQRPGIVHRIDKDTSGLIIVARTDLVHHRLAQALRERRIGRHYTALVYGQMREDSGLIDAPLARDPKNRKRMAVNRKGRTAKTHYKVVARLKHGSLLAVSLETGRTHQIRAHMRAIGHPLMGDPVYAPGREAFGLPGQALHAHKLTFDHPLSGEPLSFTAPLPGPFCRTLLDLGATRETIDAWSAGQQIAWPEVPVPDLDTTFDTTDEDGEEDE